MMNKTCIKSLSIKRVSFIYQSYRISIDPDKTQKGAMVVIPNGPKTVMGGPGWACSYSNRTYADTLPRDVQKKRTCRKKMKRKEGRLESPDSASASFRCEWAFTTESGAIVSHKSSGMAMVEDPTKRLGEIVRRINDTGDMT